MWKNLLLGTVMVVAGAASVEGGIFGNRGGGCPNGTCGKSYSYGGGYASTARPATIAQSRTQTQQVTRETAVETSTEIAVQPAPATEASQVRSYQTPARDTSTARGRILRRWSR